MTHLFTLAVTPGTVVKRPSKVCKSPYVADILLTETKNNTETLAHAPALGCNGLSDKEATVFVSKIPPKKSQSQKQKQVCEYKIELGIQGDTVVGLNPKLAEEAVKHCLELNLIQPLGVTKSFCREVTLLNSRFDFTGIDENDIPFVLEVKTVPLVYTQNDLKGTIVSYFPHGYRKKRGDPVSPRALKHLDDLIYISQNSVTRAIMCYVVQRGDSSIFEPSETDPIYKAKFYEAKRAGVEIFILQLSYTKDGVCSFERLYTI